MLMDFYYSTAAAHAAKEKVINLTYIQVVVYNAPPVIQLKKSHRLFSYVSHS